MSTPRDITLRLRATARIHREQGNTRQADELFEAAADIESLRSRVRVMQTTNSEAVESVRPVTTQYPRPRRRRLFGFLP